MTAATDFRFVLFPNIEDIPEGDSVTCSAATHLWGAQSGVLRCVAVDAINSVILLFSYFFNVNQIHLSIGNVEHLP